jgi:serine/threonine protein kinase
MNEIKILAHIENHNLKPQDGSSWILLAMISHPFVVKFDGVCQDDNYLYLLLELVNGAEMYQRCV